MNAINLLALQSLLIPALASACLLETDCNDSGQSPDPVTIRASPSTAIDHDHNDPRHRWQIIMDTHEFASKTCSFDVNCDSGYRCDLRPGFHKGVCIRNR